MVATHRDQCLFDEASQPLAAAGNFDGGITSRF
jgi:hypothetical protein